MSKAVHITVSKDGHPVMRERMERDVIKIGRLASAHIKLDEPTVSRIHAVLEWSAGAYHLIDMGSLEGTRVNGEKVSKRRVAFGDLVEVGPFQITLTDGETSAPPPTPPRTDDVEDGMVEGQAEVRVTEAPPSTDPRNYPITQPAGQVPLPQTVPGGGEVPAPFPATHRRLPPAAPTVASAGLGPALPGPKRGSVSRPRASDVQVTAAAPSSPPADTFTAPLGGAPTAGHSSRPVAAHPELARPSEIAAAAPTVPPAAVPPASTAPPASVPPAPGPPAAGPHLSVVPRTAAASAPVPAAPTWGSVPSNLASDQVPEEQRALEIKAVWGWSTVLDTVTVHDEPSVTAGDARTVTGWGPLQQVQRCDLEIPSRGLPVDSFVLAQAVGKVGGTYDLQWPQGLSGRVERADGSVHELSELAAHGAFEEGDAPELVRYALRPAETVFVEHGPITLQMRYVRRTQVAAVPLSQSINYNWLNTFLLVFFAHVMTVASFLAAPQTTSSFEEDLQRTVNRFAQIKLTPEQRRQQKSLLADLKKGKRAEKAKGKQGKAGRKSDKAPDRDTRRANKGKPDEKEQAKAILDKLLGADVKGAVASAMGTGGIGGELKSALGGVTGRNIGDRQGLGGLGTRGSGPGGGGLNMAGVGLGALGTAGRGGGGSGDYGQSAADLGKKKDRDINIAIGRTIVRGSLPKEIIRRVINQHMAQIRYCYEKELTRSPGIFGRVSTRFVIGPNGRVQDAKVPSSTLGNAAVEQCMVQKIRTWKFPKPKGGGIVIVNYPFVLKTSG
jgi:hypothetical protein